MSSGYDGALSQNDLSKFGHIGVDEYYHQRTLWVFERMKNQAFWLTFLQGTLESLVLLLGTFGVLLSTFDQTEIAMICLSCAANLQALERFHALSNRLDAANAGERDLICAWQDWSAMEPMQRRFQSSVSRLVLTTEGVNVALTIAATAGVRQSLPTSTKRLWPRLQKLLPVAVRLWEWPKMSQEDQEGLTGTMEIRVMQWNVLAHGLANDGFLVSQPKEEGASILDRARSVQVLGQTMKQRAKKSGQKIKLKDLPEEMKSWDPPPFDFAQRLKSNFQEILQEEQRYLQEITDLPKRCEMITARVKEEQPDIITFQEFDMFEALNPLLEAAGYSAGSDQGTYQELAQRVKDLGIQLNKGEGGSPKDFAQKYRELLEEYAAKGLCVCPNFDSTARRFNPDGFDDGVAIYWKTSTLKSRGPPDVWTYDMTGDAPAIRVKLQHNTGSPLDVMTLHLPSSPGKELRRQLNLWQLHELVGGSLTDGPPLILAVDLNSDAHLQPPLGQEVQVIAEDGSGKKVEFQLDQPLRQTCFQLLQNPGGPGAPPSSTSSSRPYSHPADVEAAKSMANGDFPHWGLKNAWGTEDRIPLSVVKMRGPASEQVQKWGELTLETTDHVFCSPHFKVLQCKTGCRHYNHQDKQDLMRRFKDPEASNQEELCELLKWLIPSSTIPSDHMCVLATFQLSQPRDQPMEVQAVAQPEEMEEDFMVGDRVLIKAAKEEPKAWEGTVRFIGLTDFATGEWLGVELDIQAGKNDGSVHGKRYFQCEDKYGLFLRPGAVQKVKASKAPRDIALEKAKVQEALALAMEDHDIQTIRRVLPAAESLGIDPKEIHFARQIVDSVASYDLQGEVNGLCSSLLKLRRTLENIEASSNGRRPGATQGMPYQELERRLLSESLPKVLEQLMQGATQRPGKTSPGKAGAAGSKTEVPQANHQKPPAGTASASTTTPAQSEGSVKQKFRKNLVAGLKDGSLETVVKSIPDTGQ